MENEKSEFTEAVSDMSRLAGALAGAALVAGKKLIRYLNDLTIEDSNLKHTEEDSQRKE